jgi:3-phenylpropionate/trans-cinnamate dioxygenase ferredoxin reductase component
MERIVIIGAGQAAAQAVTTLRSEGFGGAIAIVGDEAWPPYQRPPLSKTYLAGEFARERLFLKSDSFYAETRCDLRLGVAAERIDRASKQVIIAGGETISYDKLLLTTGARVRPLSVPGADLPGVHYLRKIDDVDRLRPALAPGVRLAVVGGGYIGLEVAAVAAKRGLHVIVIEAADRVMVRAVSPPISAFYEAEHRAHGVEFLMGAGAQSFAGAARVEAVVTERGVIAADAVLIGVGIVPNCEIAANAGIACDNGILVDEFAATSDPDIFAAGDCTSHPGFDGRRVRLECVQNAIDQACHAALAMAGKPRPYSEVPWFWSDQYDLKLQIAGLVRPGDAAVLRSDPKARKFAVFHLRDGVAAAVEAVSSAPDYIVGRKLIAARARVDAARLSDPRVPIKSFA